MPRFVILFHELPLEHDRGTHFDLMFEMGGVLRTWSLPELLSAGRVIQAEALPDHRLAYLDYEGAVSGNRGSVSRVEAGEYDLLEEDATLLRCQLAGKLLDGTLCLKKSDEAVSRWDVTFLSRE